MAGPRSILIIGAGVVGVCAAYFLARRGARVTLLERGRLEEGASKGNAGIIALGHPPIPRPGLIWQTIKWMLDKGSPLYVPPRFDPGLLAWMWSFRKACTREHFERCMNVLAAHGWETGKLWDQIVAEERIDCEYRTTGWLDVFRTREGMEHGLHEAALLRAHGYTIEELSGAELRRREPAFRDEIIGAAHYVDSRFCNPRKFLLELARRVQELGVELRTETEVTEIITSERRFKGVRTESQQAHKSASQRAGEMVEADTLILAAGVWTGGLAKPLGIKVPMQAGKGYHVNLTAPQPCPTIACVLNETFVAVNPMDGGLRLAGTVELSGINDRMVQRRLDMLTVGARNYLRGIDETRILSRWCGLRPCTADGLPVIDWAPRIENVFIATGHAKYGLAYGPITGRLASECILDGRASLDISLMRADRF